MGKRPAVWGVHDWPADAVSEEATEGTGGGCLGRDDMGIERLHRRLKGAECGRVASGMHGPAQPGDRSPRDAFLLQLIGEVTRARKEEARLVPASAESAGEAEGIDGCATDHIASVEHDRHAQPVRLV